MPTQETIPTYSPNRNIGEAMNTGTYVVDEVSFETSNKFGEFAIIKSNGKTYYTFSKVLTEQLKDMVQRGTPLPVQITVVRKKRYLTLQ